ncbi:hypothetical protein OC835_002303, partial [Tilletia horrida]
PPSSPARRRSGRTSAAAPSAARGLGAGTARSAPRRPLPCWSRGRSTSSRMLAVARSAVRDLAVGTARN